MVFHFRCQIPGYEGDSYVIQDTRHGTSINLSIPYETHRTEGESPNTMYAACHLLIHNIEVNGSVKHSENIEANRTGYRYECNQWVYDTADFDSTFTTQVSTKMLIN